MYCFYCRLTPAYAFMIIIYSGLVWYWWDGPNWPTPLTSPFRTFDQSCDSNWYLSLLYVNNLFDTGQQVSITMCYNDIWYVALVGAC